MPSLALKLVVIVWQRHYRIPESRYWLGLLVSLGIAIASLLLGLYTALFDGETFDHAFFIGVGLAGSNLVLIALCIVGIARWKLDRRRARGCLVIPYFHEFAGAKDRSKDARLLILGALKRGLGEAAMERVYPISAAVDAEDGELAARLLRSLRAEGLVHGRTVDRGDGGWTVHARLVRPAFVHQTHYDWHTSDATPGRRPWRAWFSRLPSTRDVSDEEFPLELDGDLVALVRAFAGSTQLTADPAEAERYLSEAIAAAPGSRTASMDVLRLNRAMAIFVQGERQEEALETLRVRIAEGGAFGELLRGFAFLASMRRAQVRAELQEAGEAVELDREMAIIEESLECEAAEKAEMDEEHRGLLKEAERLERKADELFNHAYGEEPSDEEDEEDDDDHGENLAEEIEAGEAEVERLQELHAALPGEAQRALEAAVEDKSDPGRDVSIYNLICALLERSGELVEADGRRAAGLRGEAWGRLEQLREESSYYRDLWYVQRLCGVRAWMEFEGLRDQQETHSEAAIAAAAEAARWYSRAIRSRPKLMLHHYQGARLWRRYRIRSRRSPILDANAFDAHFFADHSLRARYHAWRLRGRRRALMRDAVRNLQNGYLDLAYIEFDWTIVGNHAPEKERFHALEAVAITGRERIKGLTVEAREHEERQRREGVSEVEFGGGGRINSG